ncbi:hypothetical protein PSAC2689_10176 [Paraburkholderia sacchari]
MPAIGLSGLAPRSNGHVPFVARPLRHAAGIPPKKTPTLFTQAFPWPRYRAPLNGVSRQLLLQGRLPRGSSKV